MSDKNILVIEDDEGIQAVTKFSLEMEDDWKVTSALCGKEGLIKAKSLHPDVILLDLVMPDINGIDILKELQSNQPTKKIPIILFTAKAVTINIPELQDNNVIGIITKPFDCLTLSAKIVNILKNS
ncbi:Two-component system response regulator [Hyella patelloides LEGE 07179]|uniref:Two-component system response regulator n=1 Tax=Hyella patelloides LEGE 07179 TaxID=945734 RepID=A0A563W058_9CYAN|nr:response regulator [Hyella patelloides]VEP16903.1 Two-component system response regulator [Hyella patelloides LEGE 07179]